MGDKPRPDPQAERGKRLAEALRANLRRRKAPAPAERPDKATEKPETDLP